ncbi:unnamed protein product [Acanthoscelides obtectus]|uniref:DDE Tnp4 domain-containing protein n=1 Tax=Acanthoscelides obtectus TaxID=200917 RepID=A0A9P0KMH2_ACAOB|nr:unnamed protein product [Acanthoscelides obtectus]CAK1656525.1 hypothetical protein AOBTE_LOCUS19771 [Acanthoscelides obtectus]
MTPYRDPLTPKQISYNRSRERVIIERRFGQVKQRFPILQTKVRIKTEKVSSFILNCFILHNVAKHLNEENFEILQDLNNNGDEAVQMPVEYGKPSTSASSQQLGEVCSVTTSQPENLDVTTVEPIEEHSSEASE